MNERPSLDSRSTVVSHAVRTVRCASCTDTVSGCGSTRSLISRKRARLKRYIRNSRERDDLHGTASPSPGTAASRAGAILLIQIRLASAVETDERPHGLNLPEAER